MSKSSSSAVCAILCAFSLISFSSVASALTISEIDLTNNKVELVNLGTMTEDLSTYWWCNRVNGSPFYQTISSNSTIDVALSTATSLSSVAPGEILVLDVPAGLLRNDLPNGEIGLYNTNSFGSSAAIEDYVLWGANGIRDVVAAAAGIWNDNELVSIAGLGAGDTIQLTPGFVGNQASDYELASGTLGSFVVPEPTSIAMCLGGLCLLGYVRRRK